MTPWAGLVKAALLGTERRGRPPPAGGTDAVAALVAEVAGDPERSPERALLGAASVVANAQRAGRQPERPAGPAPAPAPADDRPEVGEEAARSLGALLTGTWRQVLPEWLEACGASGRRVPSAWLPSLLELATADRSLRPAALAAVGARGRWLAAQRPDWGWAVGAAAGEVPADPAGAWALATSVDRRALLRAVRGADPALGLALVLSTWTADRVDDRAAFVELLAFALSLDDEPFLEERALSDRGRDVRRAAAAALARLPGSRLAGRMQERALAHVAVEPAGRWRPRATLSVRLPDDLPERWAADGVDPSPRKGSGLGERAWWLCQVVAACPLDTWGPAPEAAAAAAGVDHAAAVLWGWAVAAGRQGRADWAIALLEGGGGALASDLHGTLLRVLAPAAGAAWLGRALQAAPRGGEAGLLTLAREVARPWPAPLVRAVAGRAAAAVLAPGPRAHVARAALLLVAERADPSTLARLAADLADAMAADPRLAAELRRPLALVQLRHDLLAELAGP